MVNGFAPLIFEGWMMEIVKGRAVSRTATGYADVAVVVEAVVDLSDYATGADAAALKSYVKSSGQTSQAALNPTSFVSPGQHRPLRRHPRRHRGPARGPQPRRAQRGLQRHGPDRPPPARLRLRPGPQLRPDQQVRVHERREPHAVVPGRRRALPLPLRPGPDPGIRRRLLHHRLALPAGRRHRAGGAAAHGPRAVRHAVVRQPGHPLNFTSSSESQNTYVYFPRGTNAHSGGAVLGAYGAAGLVQSDDVAYAAKRAGHAPGRLRRSTATPTATKSWFMLDDEIVVLAAGVGDPAGRAVTTTLDSPHRRARRPVHAHRDGCATAGPGPAPAPADLHWLRYANATRGTAVGYVFLDTAQVRVALDTVTRSRRVVRTSNPDTAVTRSVFRVTVDQPAGAEPLARLRVGAERGARPGCAPIRQGP